MVMAAGMGMSLSSRRLKTTAVVPHCLVVTQAMVEVGRIGDRPTIRPTCSSNSSNNNSNLPTMRLITMRITIRSRARAHSRQPMRSHSSRTMRNSSHSIITSRVTMPRHRVLEGLGGGSNKEKPKKGRKTRKPKSTSSQHELVHSSNVHSSSKSSTPIVL